MKRPLLALLLLLVGFSSKGQHVPHDGTPDSTFGYNGIVIDSDYLYQDPTMGGGFGVAALNMGVFPGGKIILLAGINNGLGLLQFSANGHIDPTFCNNGTDSITAVPLLQDYPVGIYAQPDGKIAYFNSDSGFMVGRFLSNGSLDNSFAGTGMARAVFHDNNATTIDALIQPDGRYLVCGKANFRGFGMLRYNLDGSVDSSFCNCGTGRVKDSIGSKPFKMAWTKNNKILLAFTGQRTFIDSHYYYNFILRFNADGTVDSTFASGGNMPVSFDSVLSFTNHVSTLTDMYASDDGKIIIAGYSGSQSQAHPVMARYLENGGVDSSYGNKGFVALPFDTVNLHGWSPFPMNAGKLLQQKDGRLLVLSNSAFSDPYNTNGTDLFYISAVMRYMENGVIDPTFGNNGIISNIMADPYEMNDIAIQNDSDLLIAGTIRVVDPAMNNDQTKAYLARFSARSYAAGVSAVSSVATPVTVYPNPSTNTFTISGTSELGNASITITDITGRTILNIQHDFRTSPSTSVGLAAHPPAVYFIKVVSETGRMQSVKLLKQ